jgi:hypothetical protein
VAHQLLNTLGAKVLFDEQGRGRVPKGVQPVLRVCGIGRDASGELGASEPPRVNVRVALDVSFAIGEHKPKARLAVAGEARTPVPPLRAIRRACDREEGNSKGVLNIRRASRRP